MLLGRLKVSSSSLTVWPGCWSGCGITIITASEKLKLINPPPPPQNGIYIIIYVCVYVYVCIYVYVYVYYIYYIYITCDIRSDSRHELVTSRSCFPNFCLPGLKSGISAGWNWCQQSFGKISDEKQTRTMFKDKDLESQFGMQGSQFGKVCLPWWVLRFPAWGWRV